MNGTPEARPECRPLPHNAGSQTACLTVGDVVRADAKGVVRELYRGPVEPVRAAKGKGIGQGLGGAIIELIRRRRWCSATSRARSV